MTQHLLEEQTDQDKQIMRRLITVVGFFMLATVLMAIAIPVIMN
jgi:hypothetical protein